MRGDEGARGREWYIICSCIRACRALLFVSFLFLVSGTPSLPPAVAGTERMNMIVGKGSVVRVEKRRRRSWRWGFWREVGVRRRKYWCGVVWGWGWVAVGRVDWRRGRGRARSWVWRVVSWRVRLGVKGGWRRWVRMFGRSGRWRRVVLNMFFGGGLDYGCGWDGGGGDGREDF